MEVFVRVQRIDLAVKFSPGRYNLHCNVETQENSFTKSSVFELSETCHLLDISPDGMRFTFQFRSRHSHLTTSIILADLKNIDRPVDVAEAFVPLQVQATKELVYKKTAFFTSKLKNLAIVQHIGKALLEIRVNYTTTEQTAANTSHWVDFKSTSNHLHLISPSLKRQHTGVDIPNDHDEQTLNTRAVIDQSIDISSFPNQYPSVTTLFHTIATDDITSDYHPIICFTVENLSNKNFPFVEWKMGQTHIKKFQNVSILAKRSLIASSPEQNIVALHLIKNNDGVTPVFSAYENYRQLVPFHHYHRGWIIDHNKSTSIHDPLLYATKHIITSICYMPSASEYDQYCGLEFAITNLTPVNDDDNESDRNFIVTIQMTTFTKANEYSSQVATGSFQPLFMKQTEPGCNTCVGILKSNSSNAYFFFDEKSINFNDATDFPAMLIQVCRVEPSHKPWWTSNYCWTMQQIDMTVLSILKSDEAINGVRCMWDGIFKGSQIKWTLEGVLRWKKLTDNFLMNLENEEISQLPSLQSLLAPRPNTSPQETEPSSHNETPSPVHVYHVPSVPLIHRTESSPQQKPLTINDSSTEYSQTISFLNKCIQQLHTDNALLKQQNGFLQGQLVHHEKLTATQSLESKKELEGLSKVDLIHKVMSLQSALETERAEKIQYQQKVVEIQNELLKKNSIEGEYRHLLEAHKEQQTLVQQLQRKVEKYYQCYTTALSQEKVIEQMESIISQKGHHKQTSFQVQQKKMKQELESDLDKKMEQRLERLEAITSLTQANQAELAMKMEENNQREMKLKEVLTQNEKLRFENDKLQKTISVLVSKHQAGQSTIQRTNNATAKRSGPIERQQLTSTNTESQKQTTKLITF